MCLFFFFNLQFTSPPFSLHLLFLEEARGQLGSAGLLKKAHYVATLLLEMLPYQKHKGTF